MPKRFKVKEDIEFEEGSGNVFADLGLPNPRELQIKSDLMFLINGEIKRQRLTQAKAALVAGLRQPDISRLSVGNSLGFSIERLLNVLGRLGLDVEITARRPRNGAGAVVVRTSA